MNKHLALTSVAALLLMIAGMHAALAMPVTGPEAARQAQVIDQLKKSVAAESTDAAKFAHLARAMKDERDVAVRHRILDLAAHTPGADLDAFLTKVLADDEDAGLRIDAATALGRAGSKA